MYTLFIDYESGNEGQGPTLFIILHVCVNYMYVYSPLHVY